MTKQTVEPLKSSKDIAKIEQYLHGCNKCEYVIWILGLNSGLRVSDIVALNVCDVVDKTHISVIEKKLVKQKKFYINNKLQQVLIEYTKDKKRRTLVLR